MELTAHPSPVFLAPLSLSRLLYAADLPPTPTDNLNNQKPPPPRRNPIHKHRKMTESIPALPSFPPLAPLPLHTL